MRHFKSIQLLLFVRYFYTSTWYSSVFFFFNLFSFYFIFKTRLLNFMFYRVWVFTFLDRERTIRIKNFSGHKGYYQVVIKNSIIVKLLYLEQPSLGSKAIKILSLVNWNCRSYHNSIFYMSHSIYHCLDANHCIDASIKLLVSLQEQILI